MSEFSVDRRESGQTLAALVRRRANLTWRQATELVESGRVRVGGQTCRDAARRMRPGDHVSIIAARSKRSKAPPRARLGFRESKTEAIPPGISIVYSDAQVLVVEKPPGLTTMRHAEEAQEFGPRGRKHLPKTLADFLPAVLADRWPIIAVHRLDRDTSGLVAFARTAEAAQHLGRQFRAHTTRRSYLAICRGQPKSGTIESWLVRDRGDGRRGSGESGTGQRAVTHVKLIQAHGPLALVECRLETGRTHQVRIHLGEAGCPLCGETIYDRPIHGRPAADPSGATRIMLHAVELGFVHPTTGKAMAWESQLPEDMRRIVDQFDVV